VYGICFARRKELQMPESPLHPVPDRRPDARSLRAADHDRDAVAEMLREQHLAGRLDTDELQERIERCYAAKTYAELDGVLADLPVDLMPPSDRPGPARRDRGAAAAWGPWGGRGWLPLPMLAPLLLVAIVVSHGHLVWLMLPFVFWFVSRRWRWRSTL
jgi:hypothetical protein